MVTMCCLTGGLAVGTGAATIPQTVSCSSVTGHVGFGPGLKINDKPGYEIKVNFHLNISDCAVSGGAPSTTAGKGIDISGTSRRYPLSSNGIKGLCGLTWVGDTSWRVKWNNPQDPSTTGSFDGFSIVTQPDGTFGWSFGGTGTQATGSFLGSDGGATSTVEVFTPQQENSAPMRCFEKAKLTSLKIVSGSVHFG